MRKNAFLSFILALIMVLTLILPVGSPAYAAGNSTTIDVTDTINMPANVTYSNGIFTINDNTVSTITVTGATTQNTIAVATAVTGLTLILNGVSIASPSGGSSPIDLQGTANVTIQLAGTNILNASSASAMAGLCVPSTATVTINGIGSITATGGMWGAGIGGGSGAAGGTINISSGTVIATGGQRGAGIGGGNTCSDGTVNISGGIVTATGGQYGAGIGGGLTGAGGTVNISGGTVTATGGQSGAGIGGGQFGASGIVNITGTPTIMAASDSSKPAIHAASGSGSVINATLNNAISANPTYLKCNGNELTLPGNYKSFAFSAVAASAVSAYSDQTYTTLLGSIMTNPAGVVNIPVTNLSTNPADVTPVLINIATVTVKKDGLAWTTGTPTMQLSTSNTALQGVISGTGSNGVYTFTGVDPATTYYVWDTASYTNQSVTITSSNNATVNYYTVQFGVTNAGTASGSTISAAYNSLAINAGDVVLGGKQLVITAVGQGASSYTYAWSGAGTSSQTTSALTIASLSGAVNATCKVTGAPATYAATVNLKKDGSTWTGSGKTITLQQASEAPTATTEVNGVFTANVVNGTWKVLVNGANTGLAVVVNNGAASQDLNFYTAQFAVANTGTASGSNISATYNSSPISSGDIVLGGKQLVITAAGQGTDSYTYAWSGAGTSSETTAALTIANLSATVNATCTVTGIPATYAATVNLKKDGSTWTGSSKTITLQLASEIPTATTEVNGVFTANVVNGTWKILAGGADTGLTVVVNNGAAAQDLNYYTVQFAVANAGMASGSTISAAYNTLAINSGDVVLCGKQLVITAVGQGASNYTYAWSGAGTSGETTAALTISSLSGAVNATCVVSSKAPKIITTSLPNGTDTTAYSQNLSAITIAPLTWSISSGSLPTGLSLDANTGAITGTPVAVGTSSFTVTATCSFGSDSKALSITVSGVGPVITTSSLPDGTVGTAFNQTLTATGTAPITWSIASGALPAGLNLNSSTGTITGTPTASGTSTFTVIASNGVSPDDTKSLSITINTAGTAPTITTSSLPDGTVGTAFNQTLAATGTAPIIWSITSGALPAGLNLNSSTGAITGTPTSAGTSSFTVIANNGISPDDTKSLSITINSAGTAPTITTSSLPNGTVNTAYNQTLAATGTAPITWSITSGVLPAGLNLNASTGAITGTPTSAGTSTFTVIASNGVSPDDTKSLSITINSAGTAPTITTTSLPDGTVGTAFNQTLAATGTAPITWSITSGALPAGLNLNASTGEITGTPTAAGTSTFIVQASNSNGSDTVTYTVAVIAVPATYTLTITAGSGGTVSSAGGTYAAGALVGIIATPNSNYSFNGWTNSNSGTFTNANSASTTFTMPANNTTITANFTYNGGGIPAPAPTPTPTPIHVPIIIDNNNYYIGTATVEDNSTTLTVDQSEFDKQLAAAKYNVVIPVTSDASTVVAQLVVKNVQDMNDKGVPLSVQTGNVSYNIPAYSIDTKAIISALGEADPALAPVNVKIKTNVDAATKALVDTAVSTTSVKEIVPAVQFEISASYNGKTYDIEDFNYFVSRAVEITSEQAQQITTAIVVNPDGTTRHVPTNVYQKDGKWYAEINSLTNSTYVLIFNQMSFADSAGEWYQYIVNEMGSRKIISGVGNNCFAGDIAITRAEFAAILVRGLGLPAKGTATFSDIPSNSWYSSAVATATQYGIVSGIGDNKFAPDENITREEAMQMLYNASKLTPYAPVAGANNTKNFMDYGTQSSWATNAVNFNLNNGFIQGFNGLFNPKLNITRAETAAVVLRLLQKSGLVDIRTKL